MRDEECQFVEQSLREYVVALASERGRLRVPREPHRSLARQTSDDDLNGAANAGPVLREVPTSHSGIAVFGP